MTDADRAIALLARPACALGGAVVRARPGPARDAFMAALLAALPPGTPVRRLPPSVADDRLLGGLDLAATLASGRPVMASGLLAEADGGLVIVPMAERLPPETAARLALTLDSGLVPSAGPAPARASLRFLLLDEGIDDEAVPACLAERLALHLDLDTPAVPATDSDAAGADAPVADVPALMCAIADELGCASLRAPLLALRAAQALAAVRAGASAQAGDAVQEADVIAAVRLVLAPRATRLTAAAEPDAPQPPPPPPERSDAPAPEQAEVPDLDALVEIAIEAAKACLPPELLAGDDRRQRSGNAGGRGRGSHRPSLSSGRRIGVRAGALGQGARLDLLETLKAAAPWQPVRRREAPGRSGLQVRRQDFRIRRLVRPAQATTLFVVDASGSAALARLNEAKGAVELVLADSYVRRDEVALIAFRGHEAEVLLPPTRSLARARRALADLPGGGGTPLAAAIEAATRLGQAIAARGRTVSILFLTDGRANIARTEAADPVTDALAAARQLQASGLRTLFVDTSRRTRPDAEALAAAMGARLLPLPRVEADALAHMVRAA